VDEQPTSEEQPLVNTTMRRRMLLKAAVGTGVAVAAHSAPRVGAVPAYGLTNTAGQTDNRCYVVGWSSNNPDGKGWMRISDQDFGQGNVTNPSTGPAAHAGDGTAVYTWNIPALGPTPAFVLTLTASGCVNNGNGTMVFTGMPAGLCARFYNSGTPRDGNRTTCGNVAAGDLAGPGGVVTSVLSNGQTGVISTQGETDCDGSGQGKIWWVWDVAPC
jgi:hypothetical protein